LHDISVQITALEVWIRALEKLSLAALTAQGLSYQQSCEHIARYGNCYFQSHIPYAHERLSEPPLGWFKVAWCCSLISLFVVMVLEQIWSGHIC